jgi:hypothetical protein
LIFVFDFNIDFVGVSWFPIGCIPIALFFLSQVHLTKPVRPSSLSPKKEPFAIILRYPFEPHPAHNDGSAQSTNNTLSTTANTTEEGNTETTSSRKDADGVKWMRAMAFARRKRPVRWEPEAAARKKVQREVFLFCFCFFVKARLL